jgi:diphthamide synthase subunit DPH2
MTYHYVRYTFDGEPRIWFTDGLKDTAEKMAKVLEAYKFCKEVRITAGKINYGAGK